LPIYDGRVGSGLALLVVRYCREQGLETIPPELSFGWLDGRTPVKAHFDFPDLETISDTLPICGKRFRILNAAVEQAQCSVTGLEQALFMIGYDVSERDRGNE
jgi:hypothetical protein